MAKRTRSAGQSLSERQIYQSSPNFQTGPSPQNIKRKKKKNHHLPKKTQTKRNFKHKNSEQSVENLGYSQLQPRYGYGGRSEANPQLAKKSLFGRFNYSKADSENYEQRRDGCIDSEVSELYQNSTGNSNINGLYYIYFKNWLLEANIININTINNKRN